jgi:hypothetical protein
MAGPSMPRGAGRPRPTGRPPVPISQRTPAPSCPTKDAASVPRPVLRPTTRGPTNRATEESGQCREGAASGQGARPPSPSIPGPHPRHSPLGVHPAPASSIGEKPVSSVAVRSLKSWALARFGPPSRSALARWATVGSQLELRRRPLSSRSKSPNPTRRPTLSSVFSSRQARLTTRPPDLRVPDRSLD